MKALLNQAIYALRCKEAECEQLENKLKDRGDYMTDFITALEADENLRLLTKLMIQWIERVEAAEQGHKDAAEIGQKLERQCSFLSDQLQQLKHENVAMKMFIQDHVSDPVLLEKIFRGEGDGKKSDCR